MWLALTLFAFVAFLGSIFGLTRRGFRPDGTFASAGRIWLVLSVFSASIWVWALSKVPPPYPIEKTRRYEAPNFPIPAPKPD